MAWDLFIAVPPPAAAPNGCAEAGPGTHPLAALLLIGLLVGGCDSTPPSWHRVLPADERFELVMGDEAVLDRETGLVWERSPSTDNANWAAQRGNCANKLVGGRKGWRLPAFHELATLIDPSVPGFGPLLPAGHPFTNVQVTSAYYSATTSATNPDNNAWGASFFGSGDVGAVGKAPAVRGLAWCVRGLSPAPSAY